MNKSKLTILPNGDKYWCLSEGLHRENGPAVELVNGDKYWYLNGKKYSEQDWREEIVKLNLKNK